MLYHHIISSTDTTSLDQDESAVFTRRKKQSKLLRCFGVSVLLVLSHSYILHVQMELPSSSNDDAFIPLKHKLRYSLGHDARSTEGYETVDERRVETQPPPFSQEESFAACIMFLDQNHRVTEWIAYHYFALPLRTLIIAYDPKTRERATELVKRWKHVINIMEWEDEDYLPANWTTIHLPNVTELKMPLAAATYIKRQLLFNEKCHERAVEMGIRRTIVLDLDEYFRINPEVIPPTVVNTSEPGHITRLFQQLEAPNNTLLADQEGVTYSANCSVYPRVQYTTLGPNRWHTVPKDVEYTTPDLVDPFYYSTLRYRYRNFYRMKHPKSILTAMNGVPHQFIGIHYPLDLDCHKSAYSLEKSPFLFNHYIGSFEDFLHTFRNDFRNVASDPAEIRSKWEVRARGLGNDHPFDFHVRNPLVRDDSITNWVPAFFNWQSDEVAKILLRDTGMRAVDLTNPSKN